MTVVLETQAVSKIYKSDSTPIKAVDEVSLTIRTGEFIGLVGPSGSGKTTMLAMLAALLTPSSGTIIIDDHNLAEMKEAQRTRFRREKIGFTFQQNNLLPFLNAQENVELMLRLNNRLDKRGRERAQDLLTRLGLGDRLHNLPSQLSGGQQQRVAIARALIHNPNLVLADEPTANLDTERAFQVVETFAELIHEHDRAGIMVTHDLRMCHYVDKVVQMLDGRIERIIEDRAEIEALAGTARPVETPPAIAILNSEGAQNGNVGRLAQPAPRPGFQSLPA
ncbi:MAG: ABC transporter ATP-binding protein [Anaerolineales bacterium]|nr:ABC transporter ATP-binding protein [Anaerolineales bacterium]